MSNAHKVAKRRTKSGAAPKVVVLIDQLAPHSLIFTILHPFKIKGGHLTQRHAKGFDNRFRDYGECQSWSVRPRESSGPTRQAKDTLGLQRIEKLTTLASLQSPVGAPPIEQLTIMVGQDVKAKSMEQKINETHEASLAEFDLAKNARANAALELQELKEIAKALHARIVVGDTKLQFAEMTCPRKIGNGGLCRGAAHSAQRRKAATRYKWRDDAHANPEYYQQNWT